MDSWWGLLAPTRRPHMQTTILFYTLLILGYLINDTASTIYAKDDLRGALSSEEEEPSPRDDNERSPRHTLLTKGANGWTSDIYQRRSDNSRKLQAEDVQDYEDDLGVLNFALRFMSGQTSGTVCAGKNGTNCTNCTLGPSAAVCNITDPTTTTPIPSGPQYVYRVQASIKVGISMPAGRTAASLMQDSEFRFVLQVGIAGGLNALNVFATNKQSADIEILNLVAGAEVDASLNSTSEESSQEETTNSSNLTEIDTRLLAYLENVLDGDDGTIYRGDRVSPTTKTNNNMLAVVPAAVDDEYPGNRIRVLSQSDISSSGGVQSNFREMSSSSISESISAKVSSPSFRKSLRQEPSVEFISEERRQLTSTVYITVNYEITVTNPSEGTAIVQHIDPSNSATFESGLLTALSDAIAKNPSLSGFVVLSVSSEGGTITAVLVSHTKEPQIDCAVTANKTLSSQTCTEVTSFSNGTNQLGFFPDVQTCMINTTMHHSLCEDFSWNETTGYCGCVNCTGQVGNYSLFNDTANVTETFFYPDMIFPALEGTDNHFDVYKRTYLEREYGKGLAPLLVYFPTSIINPFTSFYAQFGDSGWILVRWVKPGLTWHEAVDSLMGTAGYGDSCDMTQSFSLRWNHLIGDSAINVKSSYEHLDGWGDIGEFLFASGDGSKWLITNRDQVLGSPTVAPYYGYTGVDSTDENVIKGRRVVTRSSRFKEPHFVNWKRSPNDVDNPHISLRDLDSKRNLCGQEFLYIGDSRYKQTYSGCSFFHSGYGVFIRLGKPAVYSKVALLSDETDEVISFEDVKTGQVNSAHQGGQNFSFTNDSGIGTGWIMFIILISILAMGCLVVGIYHYKTGYLVELHAWHQLWRTRDQKGTAFTSAKVEPVSDKDDDQKSVSIKSSQFDFQEFFFT